MNFHDESNRKIDYTDKRFAKKVCRFVYYLGMGDCWYEPVQNPIFSKKMYTFWCFLSNFYILSVILSELLANFRKDLSFKEQNDALQFSVAHPTIYLKFVSLMLNKDKIREFFKTIIEDTRNPMTSRVERDAIKKSKFFIAVLAGTMFFCLSFTTLDGVRTYFKEGIPIRTLVPVWPGKYDSGALAELVRFLVQAMWWWLLTVMVAIDGVCVTGLIFLAYRFKALQLYYSSLREKFVATGNGKTQDELELELRDQLILGIKLHSKLLWCARSLQKALGNVYSVQLVQSIALLASCLIKLVRLERSLSFLFANFAFISGMIALTGTYMMAGGDVTHELSIVQASLLSPAIFDSGWEWCSARVRLRALLVVAIQCSERPVIMTAFGIYDLSYRNFISVVKTSYSFFAVMY